MIIRERVTPFKTYGKYFLSFEAPGDEDDDEDIKPNTKVVEVQPNNRSRLDFADGADETTTTTEPAPQADTAATDDAPDTGATGEVDPTTPTVTDGGDVSGEEDADTATAEVNAPGEDAPDTGEGETEDYGEDTGGDDAGTEDGGDTTNDTGDTGDANADAGTTDDAPDTGEGDDEDFGDNTGADDTGGDTGGTEDNNGDDGNKKGPGLEFDSTRKYNLFQNYMSLCNAIDNYITKLENMTGDDYNANQVIKVATKKLQEIYDLCYDYMTMRFEISTYVQSLLFYQNLVVMIQMVFDLIAKSKKLLKKEEGK